MKKSKQYVLKIVGCMLLVMVCVLIVFTYKEFNDLAGHLSGQHLEMTFANGGSQVSLDIVSGNKMTGTIEGDEVILHFTTQHS